MCVDPAWLPLEQINDAGQHEGIVADYINLLKSRTALNIVLYPTIKWSDSVQAAKDRQCDIFSAVAVTPSRREYMRFSPPYLMLEVGIFGHTHKPMIKDVETIFSSKVGIVSGYATEEIIRNRYPNAVLQSIKTPQDGLLKLVNGELDYFIDFIVPSSYYLKEMSLSDIKVLGKTSLKLPLSIASRSDEPLLADILTKAQMAISQHEVEVITRHWMERKSQHAWNGVAIVIIVVMVSLFITLFIFWQRMSVRHVQEK
ncbi:hypothetical protein GCM10023116_24560 [Kistimonas scapharcae]|uniref:Solute-binding protein family 3/N-terminal domain-containing protein n=2 Tax=Kistimonas scapharcae TaxID=1036133 RepID=A0ABP8V1R7_9GAMM